MKATNERMAEYLTEINERIIGKEKFDPLKIAKQKKVDPLLFWASQKKFRNCGYMIIYNDMFWTKGFNTYDITEIIKLMETMELSIDAASETNLLAHIENCTKIKIKEYDEGINNVQQQKEKDRLLPLKEFTDEDLAKELVNRGYEGQLAFIRKLELKK